MDKKSDESRNLPEASQRKETLKKSTIQENPWQRIAADLFGIDYKRVLDVHVRLMLTMSGNRMLTQYNNQPSNLQFDNFFARWGVPKVLFPDNDSLCCSPSKFSKYLLGTSTLFSNFPVPIILKPILKRKMLIKIAKHNLKQRDIFRALIIHTNRQYRSNP